MGTDLPSKFMHFRQFCSHIRQTPIDYFGEVLLVIFVFQIKNTFSPSRVSKISTYNLILIWPLHFLPPFTVTLYKGLYHWIWARVYNGLCPIRQRNRYKKNDNNFSQLHYPYWVVFFPTFYQNCWRGLV